MPMFERSGIPRIFGVGLGVDFPRAVVEGLLARTDGMPPETLARVEIFVNTRRMQRRIKSLFDAGPARLLPRIRLVTDLSTEAALADIPAPIPPLRRRLELTQLIRGLLQAQPDLAPRSALFDLADSLAALMDEMQGEGVTPSALQQLEVADESGHWQRSLAFVNLVEAYVRDAAEAPDAEARQRMVIERLIERWQDSPPDHPILVAGSTGSRGATAQLLTAVARLPEGGVILPGFDFDLPPHIWDGMTDALTAEDHPQYRFVRLFGKLGISAPDVAEWFAATPVPCPARNRLVSLALRPAPVTDQWMTEGAALTGIAEAAERMTLIEAPSIRAEAGAIALRLREAAERGCVAALITPDRVLTRQVTAALDRWGIVPDDSAGRPLQLTAPGRFLRHVAALFGQKVTAEALLTLLKHPLTHTGTGRGPHLLHTRELELSLRRYGPPFPCPADLRAWGARGNADRKAWAGWLGGLIDGLEQIGTRSLAEHTDHHIRLAEDLARGPGQDGSGALWDKAAGREALTWVDALRREAEHGGAISPVEYASLIQAVLRRGDVRDAVGTHPGIMIWGTLEARVQGADLVILGSLNEGTWPEAARPDPWLNRRMRHDAGLLLPERRIGLSAHDFQQAIAAPEVVLTRSIRNAEAQTVPSRWLNRLTNLLTGLSDTGGTALTDMRDRGAHWLAMAESLERPETEVSGAARPSPRPPVDARPKALSITEIKTLIRDPYAIYARHVLGLRALDSLRMSPDAPLRGTILHRILEEFIEAAPVTDLDSARARLMRVTDRVLAEDAPWPAAQRMWRARMERVADGFLEAEIARQAEGRVAALEHKGKLAFPDLHLTLTGKIDRIDESADGRLTIYDYKTGTVPTRDQQIHFDKQLALAAAMAERGAIDGLEARTVAATVYIGLGSTPKTETKPWEIGDTAEVLANFTALIAAYRVRSRGYTSRRAVEQTAHAGDYDHLARFGEWDDGADAKGEAVGP